MERRAKATERACLAAKAEMCCELALAVVAYNLEACDNHCHCSELTVESQKLYDCVAAVGDDGEDVQLHYQHYQSFLKNEFH